MELEDLHLEERALLVFLARSKPRCIAICGSRGSVQWTNWLSLTPRTGRSAKPGA
jgi:hypothetical protein